MPRLYRHRSRITHGTRIIYGTRITRIHTIHGTRITRTKDGANARSDADQEGDRRGWRVTIKDAAAYGIILTQGYGRFGTLAVSTPSMIRFGQMTEDELFVTEGAAQRGVTIENLSATDPLVILKHFGPGNPAAEGLRRKSWQLSAVSAQLSAGTGPANLKPTN